MDETSDLPPVATLAFRHFPRAHATRSASPRPLRMADRKRKLSGSEAQDDRLSKRPTTDAILSTGAQSGPSHEFDNPGMEITAADGAMSELSKVKEDLSTALQEIGELHSLIGVLRATNEQLRVRFHNLRVLMNLFNAHVDDLLPESE
ncbi:hypothetical protein H4582DRAFT_2080632 [Lactarius indigo]|nr:hypothetical protein H4582DRAFT_2080632 [Lactarius indigo]